MIVLDTDHLSVLRFGSGSKTAALSKRMAASIDQDFAVTIITVEEQMRGWLSAVGRIRDPERQTAAYEGLEELFRYFARWMIASFDIGAAREFKRHRNNKVRIGNQDLKIASIALTRGALLLTANLRDFRQVPGLQVENGLV